MESTGLVRCYYFKNGCIWRGSKSARDFHGDNCGMAPVGCPCGHQTVISKLLQHEKECPAVALGLVSEDAQPRVEQQSYRHSVPQFDTGGLPIIFPPDKSNAMALAALALAAEDAQPPVVANWTRFSGNLVESTMAIHYRYTITDHYPKGWIEQFGNEDISARFFQYANTTENWQFVLNSARISAAVKTKYLLATKQVHFNSALNRIILCHDNFDALFLPWITRNPEKKTIIGIDGFMDDYWIKSIKNLLETLQTIHEKKMAHGNANFFDSYVVNDDEMYLVLPSVDGSNMNNDDFERHKSKDLQGLKSFLLALADMTKLTDRLGDWSSFINLFDHPRISASKLKDHPIFMNGLQRAGFIASVCDFLEFSEFKFHSQLLNEVYTATSSWSSGGWYQAVEGHPVPMAVFHFRPGDTNYREYDATCAEDLFRYIRNYLHHAREDARLSGLPFDKNDAAAEISRMFPAYVSCIYTTLVQKFPNFNLWDT
ncbi:uncharacterized protein LOC132270706 [Cornus florida]|uniref:uncharacterized protein LOC132270706 n=1 Tax=Cornus florida TaxID=4283 RepID=UPI00289A5332|nr:uncharacterized protein LOC132270706 [Cornus florida]